MPSSGIAARVGPSQGASSSPIDVRAGNQGDLIVSELHGRFYEANWRDGLFAGGMTTTAISNVTFTSATLGATCTPIAGIYNPFSNNKNAIVYQAILGVILTALQATGAGPYVWAVASGQNALTLGAQPFSRKTFLQSGSAIKNMAGVALTGLVGNLVVMGAAGLAGGTSSNAALLATAAGFHTQQAVSVENVDGSIIVPPGGVLALLATTTPVAHSASSMLLWEEVISTVS